MRNVILSIILLLHVQKSLSQTGPGGVGSNNGTSSLEFWYMATDEPYADGDLVSSVSDRSGNSRTLVATGGERPTFTENTAGANNMPSFLFSLNDELESTYMGNSNENMSFGMAMSYTLDANLNIAIQHGGRNTMGVRNNHVYTDFVGGSSHNSTEFASSTWTYHHKTFANTGTDRLKFYVNNSNTDNFTHNIENRTSNTWIGGHGTGGGTGWNGSIAEVFKYSKVLNRAEQIIIANYFAAKYNISLTEADVYNEDNSGAGNYDYDVAGIGQASDGSNHTDSQGTGIVRIYGATNLDNDEFLIWGHDNGIQQAIEVGDVPTSEGVEARFERVWRVSEANTSGTSVDVGSINIRFDLSNLGPITSTDLRLLIDSDNDGDFSDETSGTGGVISGATLITGSTYEFSGISQITDNSRFTVGTINASQTPLPIELIYFDVSLAIDNTVDISWQTASETNNDFFTIERSLDVIDWQILNQVNGAGNSTQPINYECKDNQPHIGISYYRLKQTDFDGQFEYSEIQSISIVTQVHEVNIYPNPSDDKIRIESSFFELQDLTLYNSLGQNVSHLIQFIEISPSVFELNLSKLRNGLYFLKSKSNITKIKKL